jgi:16S rRNA (guanine1516-N2)-methyltransferase
MTTHTIAITTNSGTLITKAQKLATTLNLPFVNDFTTQYDYLLLVTPDYIGLQDTQQRFKPIYVDFLAKKITLRRKQASFKKEPMAQALGLRKKSALPPFLIDATAGLGQDSFILASLGLEVTMLERSPILHILLEDGLNRAQQDLLVAPIIGRMHLVKADAITYLANCEPDLIYLDPMFSERKKSALNCKEMQYLQAVVGQDFDANQLLKTALACAHKRVVIKRPRLATPLVETKPTYSLTGSSCRFDVYVIGS